MAMVWPGEALAAPMRPASEGRDQRRRGSGGGGGGRERRAGQRADWRAAAARRTGAGAGVGGIATGRLVAAAGEGEANARMGGTAEAQPWWPTPRATTYDDGDEGDEGESVRGSQRSVGGGSGLGETR